MGSLQHLFLFLFLFLSLPSRSSAKIGSIAVQIKGELPEDSLEQKARELADLHQLQFLGKVGQLKGYYLFKIPTDDPEVLADLFSNPISQDSEEEEDPSKGTRSPAKRETRNRLKRLIDEPLIQWAEVQTPIRNFKRRPARDESSRAVIDYRTFQDPAFPFQWHLLDENRHDINVTGVWDKGIYGEGVVVSVVDDGLDSSHADFAGSYFAAGSYDFNDDDADPSPATGDTHGTRCAGEIGALPNDACAVGVAFKAKVAGERILAAQVSDATEADALNYKWDQNHIYTNSWGPSDDGATLAGPGTLLKKGFEEGVTKGRGGKGSIYVWAAGNGGGGDNCNFDGYANSVYTIAIGALGRDNLPPSYQEFCAAMMAVAYSSNNVDRIATTDVASRCTNQHGGTSAAAPLAAGVLALVLEARPELTWRDVQWLVVTTAKQMNPNDAGWETNKAGFTFHHKYGFGLLDAYNIVTRAQTWKLLGERTTFSSDKKVLTTGNSIPQGTATPLSSIITIQKDDLSKSGFIIEHITVTVDITHPFRGEILVSLVSPGGGEALLATARPADSSTAGLVNWTFMTVKFWGESPLGDWTLKVSDSTSNTLTGTLNSWSLGFSGGDEKVASTPPSAAGLLSTHPLLVGFFATLACFVVLI